MMNAQIIIIKFCSSPQHFSIFELLFSTYSLFVPFLVFVFNFVHYHWLCPSSLEMHVHIYDRVM